MILSLDQGTTSSRAILFDQEAGMVGQGQYDIKQSFPRPGWVEHDPEQIWESQLAAARDAIQASSVAPADISAIGITNQRETALIWDRETGSRCIRRSYGRTGVQHRSVRRSSARGWPGRLPARQAWWLMLTSLRPSWPGFWTTWRAPERVLNAGSCWPVLWTPGSFGSLQAALCMRQM